MVGEAGFDRTGAPAHAPRRCPAKWKRQKRKSPSIAAEAFNRVDEAGFDRTGDPAHDPSRCPPNGKARNEKAPANGNAKYEKAPALLLRP